MKRIRDFDIIITRCILISCLTLTLVLGSSSTAWSQGLKGVRYFGWPSQNELEAGERAVKSHPDSFKLREELAEMYYYRRDSRRSIEQLQESIRLRLGTADRHPDLEGLANAYSDLGLQFFDIKEFPLSEAALRKSIKCWKTLIQTDRTGNAKYRLELDLDRLTACYADWGNVNMALKTYSQLIGQMKVPNDGHDNISDLNKKLRKLGILRQDNCPTNKKHAERSI